jgi:transcriptional regulator with XRE-family HTH domain
VEDSRIGAWVRSERRRLGLRQADLAEIAGVGKSTVARLECGRLSEMTITAARTVAAAVGIELPFAPRSRRGASIERQVDWRHAALVEAVLGRLAALGWETTVEYSFNHYGDRGSVDLLAWHRDARALLIVEVKSDLRNVQETLHALDVKRRVVPMLVRTERGWTADSLGVVMVLSDLGVERGRDGQHAATFDATLPARTVEVRRWLARPIGRLRGVWFLQIARPVGAKREPAGHGRVRKTSRATGAGTAGSWTGNRDALSRRPALPGVQVSPEAVVGQAPLRSRLADPE